MKWWILVFALGISSGTLFAQQPDTIPKEKVLVDHADEARGKIKEEQGKIEYRYLKGNVELRQGDKYFYSDSAITFGNKFIAMSNVIIQQGDSTSIFADSLYYDGDLKVAELFGDTSSVILLNKDQGLFTNRLFYDLHREIAIYSTGAVLDNQKTQLYSKKGYYYVKKEEIFFKDSVTVVDSAFTLRADTLKYHTIRERVTFLGPTRISQGDSVNIYCEDGYYDIKRNRAVFRKNAQYRHKDQRAGADTILYDGKAGEIVLQGDPFVAEGERSGTANIIRYDEKSEVSILEGNAHLINKGQVVKSDTIVYDSRSETYSTKGKSVVRDSTQILQADNLDFDDKTGIGLATGNVVWQDTVEKVTIVCEEAFYRKKDDYLKATGSRRPLFISIVDGDSLFMTADTLTSITVKIYSPKVDSISVPPDTSLLDSALAGEDTSMLDSISVPEPVLGSGSALVGKDTTSVPEPVLSSDSALVEKDTTALDTAGVPEPQDSISSRRFLAYRDVRIFKSDLQAHCDSLVYLTSDSLFYFYDDPIIWSDTSQFSGDTISIQMAKGQIDRIIMNDHSLMVNSPDAVYFNQVKGKDITAVFDSGEVRRMHVVGNAESIYYITDDKGAYVGPNKVACSEMTLFFKNGNVTDIVFYDEPAGNLLPMQQSQLSVEGFKWVEDRRPKSMEDLFREDFGKRGGKGKSQIQDQPASSGEDEEKKIESN